MPFSAELAARVRQIFSNQNQAVEEKKMMGGLTFMVNDKMCVGILNNDLMARIAPEEYESALTKPGARPMDFTGRPMKGYIFIDAQGTAENEDLDFWVNRALAFNDRARSYKVKKKK